MKGTLCDAVKELKKQGAKKVWGFASHGLFNGPAFDTIDKSPIEKIIVTNTIPTRNHAEFMSSKIVRLSVGKNTTFEFKQQTT